MEIVIGGKYQHYKGNFYTVIGLATHSETLEELVIYQAMYGEKAIWARPKTMFFDGVAVNEAKTERFRYISSEQTI